MIFFGMPIYIYIYIYQEGSEEETTMQKVAKFEELANGTR